jgi:hypothetical protein
MSKAMRQELVSRRTVARVAMHCDHHLARRHGGHQRNGNLPVETQRREQRLQRTAQLARQAVVDG